MNDNHSGTQSNMPRLSAMICDVCGKNTNIFFMSSSAARMFSRPDLNLFTDIVNLCVCEREREKERGGERGREREER